MRIKCGRFFGHFENNSTFLTGLLKRYCWGFFFINHSCSVSIKSAALTTQRPSLIINFTYWELRTKFQSQESCSLLSVCQLSVVFLCHFRFTHFFLHCEKMAVWRERGVNWMSVTVTARELASLSKRKPEKHLISTKCICNVVTYFLFSCNFNWIRFTFLDSNYTTLFHVFAPGNQNQDITSKFLLLQTSVSAIRSAAAIVGMYSLLLLFLLLMKHF